MRCTTFLAGGGPISFGLTYSLLDANFLDSAPLFVAQATEITPPYYGGTLVYDSTRGVPLLFGGRRGNDTASSEFSNTFYEYSSSTWHPLTSAPGPSPRVHAGLVYLTTSKKILLFGGTGEFSMLSDTWEYSY